MSMTIVAALVLVLALLFYRRSNRAVGTGPGPGWFVALGLTAAFALGFQIAPPNRVSDALTSRAYHLRLPDSMASFDATGDPARIKPLLASDVSIPYPAGDASQAGIWRSRVTAELSVSLGFDSEESNLPVELTVLREEVLRDGVIRQFVEFSSFDGTNIPAFLIRPARADHRRPGILVVPGHGDGISGAAGLRDDYQNHSGLVLARAGHVVLIPELRGFGLLGPAIGLDHRVVATNALRAGDSYKGVVVRDLQRAVNALAGLPGVDHFRVGVAGASMGGELAILLSVLDTRIAATAVNSHGMHVGPVSDASALEHFSPRHGCHILPAGAPRLALEDWYRLLVPRPLLIVDGESDLMGGARTLPARVEDFEAAVGGAYAVADASSMVTIEVAPGGHEFFVDETAEFFARHFRQRGLRAEARAH